jgi:cytochrome c biogenesis protein CcmG/thiol:disulfide interchange protein DsbE
MNWKLARRLAPIAVFVLVVVAFAFGLRRDPSTIPTVLIDTEAPQFDLAPIQGRDQGFSSEDLKGQVSIVNIFASWCVSCVYEHPELLRIKAEGGPPIYGLAWKDAPGATAQWLDRHGDPYTAVGDDAEGRVAIDFGVTGAPESFVIDKEGRIRYKHIGVITADNWRRIFTPMIAELRAE